MSRSLRALSLAFVLTALGACDGVVGEPAPSRPVQVEAPLKSGGKAKGKNVCAIKCAAPPAGCAYEGALTTGPCNKVTCGDLVCEETCALPQCAAPPAGCNWVGANFTTCPYSCGTLQCTGGTF